MSSWRPTRTRPARSASGTSSAPVTAPTSRPAGRTAGAPSTSRSASAASGSARPGWSRRPTRSPSSSTPAARSAPARTRRRSSASSCCRSSSRARCSTSAAARACSRSRRRCSASTPVLGVDVEEPLDRGDARERRSATASSVDARLVGERGCPAARGDVVVANISLDAVRAAAARGSTPRRARHVGLLRVGGAASSRATSTSTGATLDAVGGRRASPPRKRLRSRAVATFRVDFLGCKVSHADAHEVREALLRDGHAERAASRPTSR